MESHKALLVAVALCLAFTGCGAMKYLKGGIHRDLNENLTIVGLTENPNKYLDKDVTFSVRYYKKGDLPCPLGDDYVNFIIADRVSYITLDKVWVNKDKAKVLDSLKEMETVVMKAHVFQVDKEKDPNLEALEIVPEQTGRPHQGRGPRGSEPAFVTLAEQGRGVVKKRGLVPKQQVRTWDKQAGQRAPRHLRF